MSALDEGRLAEIEASARGDVSPGPWSHDGGWTVSAPAPEDWGGPWLVALSEHRRGDAEHIAAADPETVLALVAEVRAARAALGRVEALADEWSALCPPGEWPDEGGIDHAVLADAGRMMLAALREALAGTQEPSSDEVAPGPTDDATGPQIAAHDCPDCEWVPRPQRWLDMANGVEPELVPGRACARHWAINGRGDA